MLPKTSITTDNSQVEQEQNYATAESHLVKVVASELEGLRQDDYESNITFSTPSFPRACLALMYSIPGNDRCIDCGCPDPSWASTTYGTLLCLNCSGKHRGMGVKMSKVRSVYMDDWSHDSILHMLEGGNEQLSKFFRRHKLDNVSSSSVSSDSDSDSSTINVHSSCQKNDMTFIRYKTKAALYYREQLQAHVSKVIGDGQYEGRSVSRTPKNSSTRSPKPRSPSKNSQGTVTCS